MELRRWRYFLAVAETLSFRGAAEKLRVAQPSLSAQIKALEAELGARLFERSTRSVRLTPAGRLFMDEALGVLAATARAADRVRAADQGLAGTLRLGFIAPAANAWLAGILRDHRQRFPGVEFSFFDLTSTEQIRRLRLGELDAGLLRPPITSPELACKFVAETRQVLALPADHPLATKPRLHWRDFHDQELVLVDPAGQHGFYDPFLAECAKAGARPRCVQYANDIQTKMWLISAGFGIAPTTATIEEIQRPGLVFRPLPPGLPPVPTVLAWRRDDHFAALRHLCDAFPAVGG